MGRRDSVKSNKSSKRDSVSSTTERRKSTKGAPPKPILVTGATGYIGSHLVKLLLSKGEYVRGTVRSTAKAAFLKELPNADSNLELVEADLTKDEGWKEACEGCDLVHHVASPFFLNTKDPMNDLIKPALEGTERVLTAAHEAGVRRVVLTSSMAAICNVPAKGKVYSEADWDTFTTPKRLSYSHSKVLAEKKAWELQEKLGFELVVINPGGVFGPALSNVVGESCKFVLDMTNPKKSPFSIPSGIWAVDVRDVAECHYRAGTSPKPNERYVCTAESITFAEIAKLLSEKFPEYRFPKKTMAPLLLKTMSFVMPGGMGAVLRAIAGKTLISDNSKIKADLGITFRPLNEGLVDMFNDFIERGHVTPKTKEAPAKSDAAGEAAPTEGDTTRV